METTNSGIAQRSLIRQLRDAEAIFQGLDDIVDNKISSIPTSKLFSSLKTCVEHFLFLSDEVDNKSMDIIGVESVKEMYSDYTAARKLLEKCINIDKNNNELKFFENVINIHSKRFKEIKAYISKQNYNNNIHSRLNMLINGGMIVEKSKLIENLSSNSKITNTNTNSSYMKSSIQPAQISDRPRSISPSPIPNENEKLLNYYSSLSHINIETMINISYKFNSSVLIIDFRPQMMFEKDHISIFSNVVNIDPVSVKPSYTIDDISLHSFLISNKTQKDRFLKLAAYDLIIIVDQNSSQFDSSNELKNLISILYEKNRNPQFRLKRKPIFLEGGFNQWKNFMNNDPNSIAANAISPIISKISINSANMNNIDTQVMQPTISRSRSPISYMKNERTNNTSNDYDFINTINKYNTSNYSLGSYTSPQKSDSSYSDSYHYSIRSSNRTRSPSPTFRRKNSLELKKPKIPEKPTNYNSLSSIENLDKSSPVIISGLVNLGNSCYLNASLQCLVGTDDLSTYILQNSYQNQISKTSKSSSGGKLTKEYHKLLETMALNTKLKKPTNPEIFKKTIGKFNSLFDNYDQQDSAEFLHFLLDSIHEDLNMAASKNQLPEITDEDEKNREILPIRLASTIEWERYLITNYSSIVEIFTGQYASRLECTNCYRTSTTYIPFNMLSVPIPNNKTQMNIYDCIDNFVSLEILTGNNAWKCPSCQKSKSTKKQLTITRLPKVLIVHLERFSVNNRYEFVKNNKTIDIPTSLKMGTYIPKVKDLEEQRKLKLFPTRGQEGNFEYRLSGVVRHYGTLNSGHYTSDVRENNKWIKFDDDKIGLSNVGKAPESDGSAYICFYEKIG